MGADRGGIGTGNISNGYYIYFIGKTGTEESCSGGSKRVGGKEDEETKDWDQADH